MTCSVMYLSDPGGLKTVSPLLLEVSVRTVFRDVEALCDPRTMGQLFVLQEYCCVPGLDR